MTGELLAAAAAGAALGYLQLEWNLLGRAPRRALRVLMYHRVGEHPSRDTVDPRALDAQLAWLRSRGHAFIGFSQLLAHRDGGADLPDRPVLLTFDDGTADLAEVALPVLRRHGATAGLFVVPGFLGRELDQGGGRQRFLSAGELRAVAAAGLEIGIHSHDHRDLSRLDPSEVEEDAARCFSSLAAQGLPVQPVLAYPFGRYPRSSPARQAFFAALRRAGVRLAFRIGNRVNPLPLAGDYELTRTGIRRGDGRISFAVKVRKGRRRAFA
jgi:peptidoglycan/xylan/chitin deacetylase (PgdA/CDA1 family)